MPSIIDFLFPNPYGGSEYQVPEQVNRYGQSQGLFALAAALQRNPSIIGGLAEGFGAGQQAHRSSLRDFMQQQMEREQMEQQRAYRQSLEDYRREQIEKLRRDAEAKAAAQEQARMEFERRKGVLTQLGVDQNLAQGLAGDEVAWRAEIERRQKPTEEPKPLPLYGRDYVEGVNPQTGEPVWRRPIQRGSEGEEGFTPYQQEQIVSGYESDVYRDMLERSKQLWATQDEKPNEGLYPGIQIGDQTFKTPPIDTGAVRRAARQEAERMYTERYGKPRTTQQPVSNTGGGRNAGVEAGGLRMPDRNVTMPTTPGRAPDLRTTTTDKPMVDQQEASITAQLLSSNVPEELIRKEMAVDGKTPTEIEAILAAARLMLGR